MVGSGCCKLWLDTRLRQEQVQGFTGGGYKWLGGRLWLEAGFWREQVQRSTGDGYMLLRRRPQELKMALDLLTEQGSYPRVLGALDGKDFGWSSWFFPLIVPCLGPPNSRRFLIGEECCYLMLDLFGGRRILGYLLILVARHRVPHNPQVSWWRRWLFHSRNGFPQIRPVDATCLIHVVHPISKLKAG